MQANSVSENAGAARLKQYIETESGWLSQTLRFYLYRAGLLQEETAVTELVNELVVEALAHAGRFDPSRPPKAWLLGIAANLIKRRQARNASLEHREPLAGDLTPAGADGLSEDEILDRLAAYSGEDLEARAQSNQALSAALARLAPADRQLIHLYAYAGLDSAALAAELKISPGAARVRLHRALNRLRRFWRVGEEEDND